MAGTSSMYDAKVKNVKVKIYFQDNPEEVEEIIIPPI